MKWMRRAIASIKETVEEMALEVREDRENFNSMWEELDIAGIKGSLDELTYEVKEDRYNINSMMEELLAEIRVQQRE